MAYGATADRFVDPTPDFTPEEQSTANLLSENYVKWIDADEITLRMEGMNSY